tara:strand:+ start:323 stop:928 length:606 start_codon:yes stop_codon:yes gene_type:complete
MGQVLNTFRFNAISGQTIFSGTDANGALLVFIADAVEVYLNGIILTETDDYIVGTDNRTITLVEGAGTGDQLTIVAYQRQVSGDFGDTIALSISEGDDFTVSINNFAVPTPSNDAGSVTITPTGIVTATTLQGAIEQLAANQFKSNSPPTGAGVDEGDTWYDLDDNQMKVYRETSSGVFQWVPLIIGSPSGDSDTLDAGSF